MSDDSPSSPGGAASAAGSPPVSQPPSARRAPTTGAAVPASPQAAPEQSGSASNSRPPSAAVSRARSAFNPDDPSAPASQSSIKAAADAQAAVLRDAGGAGGSAVPPVPMGMAPLPQKNYQLGLPAHLQATLFAMEPPAPPEAAARVTVPRLDDLLIKALADNYHLCPAFDWIPAEYLENVVNLLTPGKLDFVTAASLVQSEQYWARMSRERWGPTATVPIGAPKREAVESLDLALHGQSWKRLYCEKHLREALEKYHHSKQQHNYKRLLREVEACKPYVHTLHLGELQSHLDVGDLLYDFPHLSSLDLKWGAKKVGMDFDRSLFGMTLGDAVSLGNLLSRGAGSLTRLSLRENLVGDEAVLLLMQGLAPQSGGNQTLTHLDLSHNKIGDIGARKLAHLLDGGVSQAEKSGQSGPIVDSFVGTVLTELNLSDNHIRSAGASAFGAALANNRGLRRLDLSLNALGDGGGVALLGGCTQHTSLRELVLSSTELGAEAGEALLNLLKFNRSLDALQLACNPGLWEAEDKAAAGGAAAGTSAPSSARGDPSSSLSPRVVDRMASSGSVSGGGGELGASLLDALRQNEQIVVLDLRRNKLAPRVEQEVKELLAKRLARVKQAQRKAFQKDWDVAM